MSIHRFLIRRILYLIPTVFLVTLAVFSILQLIPGDPVDALLGYDQNQEMREILIKQFGFDKPIYVQYFRWVSNVMRGDLGQSILHARPVSTLIKEALPRTAYLALAGMAIALLISFPLGIVAAVKRKSWVDYAAQVSALIGLSLLGGFDVDAAFRSNPALVPCCRLYSSQPEFSRLFASSFSSGLCHGH